MKYTYLKKIFIAFAAVLIIPGIFSLYKGIDSFSFAAGETLQKSDRLLSDMGVLPNPYLAHPIHISLKNINGKEVRLSDFRGKIVFLNFWASWCPDCRIEMPSMEKLHLRFKKRKFVMIAVNLEETTAQVRKFFQKNRLTFIALLDSTGRVGTDMGIRSIPTTFIIDKNGEILGTAIGSRKWDSKKSITLFEYLIHGKSATSSKSSIQACGGIMLKRL